MTWRSTLKAKARKYVVRHYSLGGHQPAEDNLTKAQELVRGTMFVQDGIDEDVCPYSLASYCTESYFTGYDEEHGVSSTGWPHCRFFLHWTLSPWKYLPGSIRLGGPKGNCLPCCHCSKYSLIPQDKLTRNLQLRAAIEEYSITGSQQDRPFEYATYSKVFMQLMGMQAKIDANPKHAAKTQAFRISWATTGRYQ